MISPVSLLPPNATVFENALSLATDMAPRVIDGIDAIVGAKYRTPRVAGLLPFLIAEYGLGEVTPYVPGDLDIIDSGVHWQRIRGTPAAVAMGLAWLSYTATLEEAPLRRLRWNLFQLGLNRVRDNEVPDLKRIEGVANLSVPLRSKLFRGFCGYDVRASETSWTKTSGSIYSDDSGVNIDGSDAKWSFGRSYDLDTTLSQADLTALGVWIAPSTNPFTWATANFPWYLAAFPWGTPVNTVRQGIMAALLAAKTCWVEFKDSGGNVIGYRCCRAIHQVQTDTSGIYAIGSTKYALADPTSQLTYVEAMTDFGEGYGLVAATAGLRFDATPADPTTPGALWLGPGKLTMPLAAVAVRSINITFGRTAREQVRTLLRFT